MSDSRLFTRFCSVSRRSSRLSFSVFASRARTSRRTRWSLATPSSSVERSRSAIVVRELGRPWDMCLRSMPKPSRDAKKKPPELARRGPRAGGRNLKKTRPLRWIALCTRGSTLGLCPTRMQDAAPDTVSDKAGNAGEETRHGAHQRALQRVLHRKLRGRVRRAHAQLLRIRQDLPGQARQLLGCALLCQAARGTASPDGATGDSRSGKARAGTHRRACFLRVCAAATHRAL